MDPIDDLPRRSLRVAVAQAEAVPADISANAVTAARIAAEAGAAGVRLLVLPELFLTAYDLAAIGTTGCGVEADADGFVRDQRLDALTSAAVAGGVTVVVSAPVLAADGHRYLAALVVTPDGVVRDGYHKRNLIAPYESDVFERGRHDAEITVDEWRIALGICYDGTFPEHARAAAVAGAHVYACPAAYSRGGEHRRDLYYAARALDNTFYVLLANAVSANLSGGSAIYDPEGRPISRAANEGEALVIADLDPTAMAETRTRHTMLADHLARLPE